MIEEGDRVFVNVGDYDESAGEYRDLFLPAVVTAVRMGGYSIMFDEHAHEPRHIFVGFDSVKLMEDSK